MAMFLTSTLFLSVFGMSSIITTKRFEDRTGHVLFAVMRPRVARGTHAISVFFLHTLPVRTKAALRRAGRYVRSVARHALAASILWLEGVLERMLHAVRHTTPAQPGTLASSPFLQEVTEYKKALMRRAPSKRRIVSEE